MSIQYLQSFITGLLISLSGSLPLGNLNITVMQIAIKETLSKAIWFTIGVIIVEFLYLLLTLNIISKYAINEKIFFYFQWLSILVLATLAIGNFIAAGHKNGKNIILNNHTKRFHLGLLMSIANPMQVPFWAGWAIYLISRSIISNTLIGFVLFSFSAGMGTFMALLVFIFAGKRFSKFMLRKEKFVNMLIGCLFTTMAIFQFLKLCQH